MSYSSGTFVSGLSGYIIDRSGNIRGSTLNITGASTLTTMTLTSATVNSRIAIGSGSSNTLGLITSGQGLTLDTIGTSYTFSNVSGLAVVSLATIGNSTAIGLTNITATSYTALYLRQPAFSGFTVTNRYSLLTEGDVRVGGTTVSTSGTTGALTVAGGLGVAGDVYIAGTINGSVSGTTLTASAGSAATPGFKFSGLSAGMYYDSGSTSLVFANAGAGYLSIGNTGNVEIPTGTLRVTSNGSASAPAITVGTGNLGFFYNTVAATLDICASATTIMSINSARITAFRSIRINGAGTAAICAYQIAALNDGFYGIATGNIAVSAAGTTIMNWTAANACVTVAGSAAAPSLIWSTDTTTGLYRPASNQIGISISGAQLVNYSSAGMSLASGSLSIAATTNQITLGTTGTTTISAVNQAAARTYSIQDAGGNANFIMTTFTGGQTIAGGLTLSGTTTFSGAVAASGSNAIDFSSGTGIFRTSTGAVTIGPGTTTISGKTTFTAQGSSTASLSSVYVNPASTALSGSSNFFFTYFATPATSSTTTGSASTIAIQGAPTNAGGTAYALHVLSGRTLLADSTASTTTTTGALIVSGGLGLAGNLFAGGTLNGTAATLSALTNQIVMGTTNTTTISATAPAASRTYTLPDAGSAASFILSTSGSGQSIAGGLTTSGGLILGAGITATAGAINFSGSSGAFTTSTGACTIGPGAVSITGAATLSSGITVTSGNINFSGSSGTFTTPTGACTIGPGAISMTGITNLTAAGSATASTATLYVNPASTALTGSNNYHFTYFAAPATSGSTSGIASTVNIANSPSGATTAYSLYIQSGKTYLADTTAAASHTTGALTVAGGVGVAGDLYVNGTIFGTVNGTINTSAVSLTATTNQIVLGTTFTTTITSPAPVASRTYTIPDAGGAASFIMSTSGSGQSIAGGLTASSGSITTINGAFVSTANGTVSAPAFSVGGSNTGMYAGATGQLNLTQSGSSAMVFATSYIEAQRRLRLVSGDAAGPGLTFAADSSNNTGLYLIDQNQIGFSSAGTLRWDYNIDRISSTIPIYLPVGSAAAPSLNWNDITTGLYRPASNQIGISISGAQLVNYSSTGINLASGSLSIAATTNQIALGTTGTTTISAVNQAAARTYSIQDAGGNANFVMTSFTGGQTIAGGLTLSGTTTFGGALVKSVAAAMTSNTTLDVSTTGVKCILPVSSTAAFTVTLPATTGNDGLEYIFINVNTGDVTITTSTGTEYFDGNSSYTSIIMSQHDRLHIVCYNGMWYTL